MPAVLSSSQESVQRSTSLPRRVLIMAAGTGGHVFPALAVAESLRAQGVEVHWLATPAGMEHRLVTPTGIPLHPIDIAGLRGKGIRRLFGAPFQVVAATLAAWQLIRALGIDAVVGFGGYVAAPGGLAARLAGVPLIIHEQNAIAGMTNRYLGKLAQRVCQAFPNAFPESPKVITTGNPVRDAIKAVAPPAERYANRAGPLRVLVVGGSLGAQPLNETVPQALFDTGRDWIVTHQCGQNDAPATQARYDALHANAPRLQATAQPFIHDMATAYGEADLVICRAGASTVSELASAGVPAVFIPLPHAVDDHQTANARYLADRDAAVLLPQREMTPTRLADTLNRLADRTALQKMAECARELAHSDATEQVVQALASLYGAQTRIPSSGQES